MSRVVVVGGGASGLMAASSAAFMGADVTLIEKNKKTARKVLITGKGRCNVTNNCTNNVFIENVNSNPRFLYSAINAFDTSDTMAFFEENGVALKTERGNRVFPVSDKALDVANALERSARRNGVHFVCETTVGDIIVEGGKVRGIKDVNGKVYPADSVIIATGGCSYTSTGSTGDGYRFAESVGHSVIKPEPSLIPLVCSGESLADCKTMQGLSLRNISLRILCDKKEVYSDFGELLFTHFGLSGPTVLSASAKLREPYNRFTASVDLKPALDFEKLDKRLVRDLEENKNREFANSLAKLLPSSMIPVVLRRLKFSDGLRCNSVTREQRHKLLELLKNMTFDISGVGPMNDAIITRGGVSVNEIDPATMQSKLVSGLFFCGEVLDVDAYTGGFNLQIAFSTGKLAGDNAAWNE